MDIRWGDMDTLGHVNNVQLLRYLECGRVAYCSDVLDLDLVRPPTAGWILADLQSTFHQQLRFPGKVVVATRFSKLGRSSAKLEAAIFQEVEDAALLSSQAVLVWFDFKRQTSATIPGAIRDKISVYEKLTPAAL